MKINIILLTGEIIPISGFTRNDTPSFLCTNFSIRLVFHPYEIQLMRGKNLLDMTAFFATLERHGFYHDENITYVRQAGICIKAIPTRGDWVNVRVQLDDTFDQLRNTLASYYPLFRLKRPAIMHHGYICADYETLAIRNVRHGDSIELCHLAYDPQQKWSKQGSETD